MLLRHGDRDLGRGMVDEAVAGFVVGKQSEPRRSDCRTIESRDDPTVSGPSPSIQVKGDRSSRHCLLERPLLSTPVGGEVEHVAKDGSVFATSFPKLNHRAVIPHLLSN